MVLLSDGIANSIKPAGEDLSQVMSLKTMLSDCAKAFVAIKKRNKKLIFAESLVIIVVLRCRRTSSVKLFAALTMFGTTLGFIFRLNPNFQVDDQL